MANPNVSLGSLNRLIASVIWPEAPRFNISPSFLMREGISFSAMGESVTNLEGMTGIIPSPEPYMKVRMMIHLIKSQALADIYKSRMEADCRLGDASVRPDSRSLSPFAVGNCSIVSVDALTFSGRDAGFVLGIEGQWNINADYWL